MEVLCEVVNACAKPVEQLATAGQILLKRIQSMMKPAGQHLVRTARDVRHMDLDLRSLPDAVETADSLLQKLWIERKIKQHQVMGELEVAALAPNLGSDEEPCAICLGKPGRIAIPLHQ